MDSLLQTVTGTEKQQLFCVEMMKCLDIQRRNEHFCDVILEVGSGDDQARLKAHKNVLCAASPFFFNAFNSDMKEKKEGVIRLEETSKAVVEQLLEYLYTGHVDINEHNVFDLLEMADFVIVPSLKLASAEFISRTLSPSNCIMAYYSAVRYQCPVLQKHARDFIFANFTSVTESEDFLKLNVEQVEEWISSDEIKVNSEEEVFQVIVKWIEGSDHKEHEGFFKLFRHVRIVYVSRNFVFDVILHHPLVKDNETCTEFVLDAMKAISNGTEECFFAQPPRGCLKTYEDALVVCKKKKTFSYLPSENKWYEMADMMSEESHSPNMMTACHGKLYLLRANNTNNCTLECYDPSGNTWSTVSSLPGVTCTVNFLAVINFQGCLYFIGGTKNKKVNNGVYKYNPDTNLWQEVAPLCVARLGVCAVADGSSLYAIGGKSNNEVLDLVERFDPKRNSWSRVASTVEKIMFSSGVIVKGKVFLFGGLTSGRPAAPSSLIEMYDPASNVWTSIQNLDGLRAIYGPKVLIDGAVNFKEDVFLMCIGKQRGTVCCSLHSYDVDKNEWKPGVIIPGDVGAEWVSLARLRIPKYIFRTLTVAP